MKRYSLLLLTAALLLGTVVSVSLPPVAAPEVRAGVPSATLALDGDIATLQEELESQLLATRPSQFEFIGRVVELVEDEDLSVGVVRAFVRRARWRRPRYPFPYFEMMIRKYAERERIDLDI